MPHFVRRLPLVLALLALAAGTALSKDPPKPAGKPGGKGAAEARADAVSKAMHRLDEDVATTEPDMNEQHKIFTTAIAGLDFLLDPAAGRGAAHPDRIDKCVEVIDRYVEGAEQAFERSDKDAKDGRAGDAMAAFQWSQTSWSLSAAAIFYAELHARGLKKANATARLKTIADLLAKSQQGNGGWGHDREGRPRIPEIEIPLPGGGVKKMKYPATLLSVSNWVSFALGISKPVAGKRLDAVIPKAKEYYKSSLSIDGTYPYDPSQKGDAAGGADVTAAARTAGSYVALRALGVKVTDPLLARTVKYLEKHVDDMPEGHGSAPHGVFFGAIASLSMGAETRGEFEKDIIARILAAQDAETGAFDCICKHQGGTICESFKNGENIATKMMGANWQTWVRAYVNALNLFAVVCEKGKLKLLDGLPPDVAVPAATTPGDPPAPK